MSSKEKWQALKPATVVLDVTETDIREAMAITGQDYAAMKAALEDEIVGVEYWINDLYQVAKRQLHNDKGDPVAMVHLNIRRRDGKPIFRDWRHFQWIKNQLVGEECEGVELYPAESRLNDTSNKYHLFCFSDPVYRFPFGMPNRDVIEQDQSRRPGHRQRRM